MKGSFRPVALGIALAALSAGAARAEGSLAVWDSAGQLLGGFGYRDNVLRSSVASDGGAFYQTSGDASLMRLTEEGSLLVFYLLGEDIRYFDVPMINYEQFLSGTAEWSVPVGETHEAGLAATYLHQHQVLDVSETEVDQRRLLVMGHGTSLQPRWKVALNDHLDFRLDTTAMRQIYEQDLDDYWEGDGRASLAYGYGNRSELSVALQNLHRYYDTREQYDAAGNPVAGSSLAYARNELSSKWSHYFDAVRHWRATSRLAYMESRDNGSGYFDYNRLLFRQQLRWDHGKWMVAANARFGWYRYALQRVDGNRRERSYAVADVRIERKLGSRWLLYLAAEQEWNASNDPLDEYNSWMAGGGAGIDF